MTIYPLVMTTDPAIEPVDLNEMKAYLKIDDDTDDLVLQTMITTAVSECENFTGRALINRGYSLFMDNFPKQGSVTLPKPPMASVTQVLIYDAADASNVWHADNYSVDGASLLARVVLKNQGQAPISTRQVNGIEIQYIAGYGTAAGDVPSALISGIKRRVADLYEHRGDGAITKSGAEMFWQDYRILGVS